MDPVPASIPFHVARAYGVSTRPASQIEAKPNAGATRPDNMAKLVAGTVSGAVQFNTLDAAEGPLPARPDGVDSLPLYRHPADKNAAATSIDAGRILDTKA